MRTTPAASSGTWLCPRYGVFDFTYWATTGAHKGNEYALRGGRRNPIKRFAEDGLPYLTFPSHHSMGPWPRRR